MRFARLFISLLLVVFASTAAFAQASRTWVSGVGDDVNPCSRTAPCKTFAGAISKTAAGGEIDVLDPGGFGPVTITKSLVIDGTPVQAGVLATGTNGISVQAGATDVVTLRGLSINGGKVGTNTRGVRFISGGALIIDHCNIWGFTQRGVSIEQAAAANVFISDSNIRDNSSNGIVAVPSSGSPTVHIFLNRVNVNNNPGFGVYFGPGSSGSVRDSVIMGNGLAGLVADQSSGFTSVDVENVFIAANGTGIQAGPGASIIRLAATTITGNTSNGYSFTGGTVVSYGNNHVTGNGGSNGPPNGGSVSGNPQ